MPFISDSLNRIKPSATMVITTKAAQLKREGKKVIGLSAGEPDFDTPEHVKQAAIEAINKGYTKYTNVEGIPELRQAIVDKFKTDNNLDYTIKDVIVGTGGKQILYNALISSINTNDEVIIPAPYWVSYPDMTLLAGGTPVIVNCPSEVGFKLTAEALEKVITKKSKWLILNSPSNPTGACYTEEDLMAIAAVVRKHDHLHVMTDDIYEYIVYDDFKFFTFAQIAPDLKDRTLTVNGVSKSHVFNLGDKIYLQPKKNHAAYTWHTVRQGQTIWDISQIYGIKTSAIIRKNRLNPNESLQAGTKLSLQWPLSKEGELPWYAKLINPKES